MLRVNNLKSIDTEPTENTHYRHAINIGSAGKSKDNNPKGYYVMLTIKADSSITNKEAAQVEFIRFEYDVEKAAKAVESSPPQDEYADILKKGINVHIGNFNDKE